jgi:outer membrane biosynthesis protein TonB
VDAEKLIEQVTQNVREAIDSAQRQADDIVRDAKAQAEGLRVDAKKAMAEAERIRADAEVEARRRLDQVQAALADLQGRLSGAPSAEVIPGPVTVPEPEPPATPEPLPEPMPEPMPDPVPEPTPDPVPEPTPQPEPSETPEPVSSTPASTNGEAASAADDSAARLVAMKLALDGTSRDDARAQLAAEYEVGDLDALLDDVYAKARK